MADVHVVYHKDEDTLFIRSGNPRPAISFDLDGEIWVRIDPDTSNIVGLEIDDFESIFLKKHPELLNVWRQVKSYCLPKKTRKRNGSDWESFIRILLDFLSSLLRDSPQQALLPV